MSTSSSSSLRRAVNHDDTLRVVTAVSTAAVRELVDRCGLTGAEIVVAGRLLTAGYLLATVAKNEKERVRVQMRGGGPVGTLLADAHGDGRGRAALQARLSAGDHVAGGAGPRPSLRDLVGVDGVVTVTRDLGMRRPYQGTVDLSHGEIDEDLERYLVDSEQLPSVLRCGVWLDDEGQLVHAAGVLVQTFPGSDPALVDASRRHLDKAPIEALEPDRADHDGLAEAAVGPGAFRTVHEHELHFECTCGPQNARRVVSSLGADDLDALAEEQEQTDVRCNYCGRVTVLVSEDLREVARQIRAARAVH